MAGDDTGGRRTGGLICAARLTPGCGVATVVTAVGMLADDRPDLTLDVLGAGPAERGLRAQVRALALEDRVRFRGLPPAASVRASLRRCRTLILPRWLDTPDGPDPLPGLVFDALAGGATVVSTGGPGRPGERGAGLCTAPDTPVGLALALLAVLDAPGPGAPAGQSRRRPAGR